MVYRNYGHGWAITCHGHKAHGEVAKTARYIIAIFDSELTAETFLNGYQTSAQRQAQDVRIEQLDVPKKFKAWRSKF